MTLRLHENRWVNVAAFVLAAILIALGILYLTGYFYLIYIRVSPFTATPLTALRYWIHYGHRPDVRGPLQVSFCIATAAIVAPIVAAILRRNRNLHGNAKWASVQQIRDANLLGAKGIIMGVVFCGFLGLTKRYLMLDGQTGILLAAPPRSGKGAGFVNTNMLNWDGSAVVLDIRKESWRVTSGFRAKYGQECFLFNPLATDGKTCQWNPLSYVSADAALRINDIQKIGGMLFPDPQGGGDPFWASSCRTLFLGLALYVFETDGLPKTIGEMMRQVMFGEGESVAEHWRKVIEERDRTSPLSDTCQLALYDFINTSANTLSSIRKTFTSKLELWLNPIVDAATSADSFKLGDLRKRRISLYIGAEPADLERLQVILNLMFQQILEENTRQMPEENPALKHQLLLMMDEFTAVGKIPSLAKSVSFLGGYNIRLCIVIQSPSQLRAEYGHDIAETIMTCMGAQIVFAPKETKHAKEISEALGVFGMQAQSKTTPTGITKQMGSVNESEQRRDLLLPQEVKGIGKLKEIVFIEDVAPILCGKIRYFKDRTFNSRLLPPVQVTPIDFRKHSAKILRPAKGNTSTAAPGVDLTLRTGDEQVTSWREVAAFTPADVANAPTLSLNDFAGSFDDIEIQGEPISDAEMKKTVDMFLETLSE